MKKLSVATLLALAVTGRASMSDESVAPPPPLPSETQQAPVEQQSEPTPRPIDSPQTDAAPPAGETSQAAKPASPRQSSDEPTAEQKTLVKPAAVESDQAGTETARPSPFASPAQTTTEMELPSPEELFGTTELVVPEVEAADESSTAPLTAQPEAVTESPSPAAKASLAISPAAVAPEPIAEPASASTGLRVGPSAEPAPQFAPQATSAKDQNGPRLGGDDGSIRPPVVFESEQLPVMIDERILEPRSADAIRTQRLIHEREARRAQLRRAVIEQRKRSGASVSRPNVIDARRYGQARGRLIYTPQGQRLYYEYRTSGR